MQIKVIKKLHVQLSRAGLSYNKRRSSASWVLPSIIRAPFTAALITFIISILTVYLSPVIVHADGGFPIIGVLHAGSRPEGIAVNTQTHMVYIAYEYPGLVVGFDSDSGKVRWHTKVGDTVTDVQVDSTNQHVFVASSSFQGKQGLLTVLDGASGQTLFTATIGSGDNALAVDPKRQRIYVANSSAKTVQVFRLGTSPTGKLSAASSLLAFGPQPEAIGVNSKLGRLYVGDGMQNTVTVYDEDSGRMLAIIPVAELPVQPLRVDEATGRVYVVCSTGQELDVIDGKTNSIIARIPASPYPEGVAFNTATGRIYVANEGQKENSNNNQSSGTTITVIDGQSFEVLGTLQIGRSPDGVEADPQLHRVYVAAEDSDAVVEVSDSIDLPLQAATNFHQAAAAHQAIFLLQKATTITIVIMILTILAATLGALLPRWHVRENPQTLPGDESSRREKYTPPV